MDSTSAPVPSDQDRLGGNNRIAPRRRRRLHVLRVAASCIAITALIVVSPGQLSPANVLGRLDSPRISEAEPQLPDLAKPDVWDASTPTTNSGLAGRPGIAFSQYVKTTRPAKLFRLGCAEGRRLRRSKDPDGAIVVLDFGRPTQKGKGRGHQWGASLFRKGFYPTSAIRRATQTYASGAWRCMGGERASTHLTVAIGTSNFGRAVTFWHGRAWGQMVNDANEWAIDQGYVHGVRFAGANDIELSWGGPRRTKAWVRGYDSVGKWPYYDYGDAAACPPRGRCLGSWTVDDVWFVAWGARSARPLPEVYTPNGIMAEQWYRLSLYSFQRHGARMWIAGVMSQRTACRQSHDSCRGMNNSPARAWHLLHRALNRDKRTAQDLHWLTDIAWTH